MKTKKILIVGKQGVGKTQLANLISKYLDIPVIDGISGLVELTNEEGVYTSNSISVGMARIGLPQGFVLIHVS